MTIKSWKAEHYLVPAADVKTDAAAVAHSLVKWRGLRADVLTKHWLRVDACADLTDGTNDFDISGRTCALCAFHDDECDKCPLKLSRGVSCVSPAAGEAKSPWGAWMYDSNPEPMIAALEAIRPEHCAEGDAP